MPQYEFFVAGSLEKVFPCRRPAALDTALSGLQSEVLSFQIVYRGEDVAPGTPLQEFRLSVSRAPGAVRMRHVRLVPGEFPVWTNCDENYLTQEPGLFPDLLEPCENGLVRPMPNQYRSVWVDIDLTNAQPGRYSLSLSAAADRVTHIPDGTEHENGGIAAQDWHVHLPLTVVGAVLPPQTLLHTEWFHSDSLLAYYHIAMDSPDYWRIAENFIHYAACECGINMLLTPVFTPPLDTAFGRRRETVQLVGIRRDGERYTFDFSRLHRWCGLCQKHGIRCLEIAHLFTQWGAYATPAIFAEENGEVQQIFGWDIPAASPVYRAFLQQFIPALRTALEADGYGSDKLYFHISDEPNEQHLESYQAARAQVIDLLEGCHVMDALSSYEFYQRGLVATPVCADNHIQTFIDHKVPDLWTYYCCAQSHDVPNRFFAMPSARNRIMGVLLYLYDIKGFLHWGFNFYHTQFSLHPVDPYRCTDAGCAFPSGDPFLVYPAADGTARGSLRNAVQMQGFADMRALQKLESLAGRSFTESLIREAAGGSLPTFQSYPHSARFLYRLRAKVNQEIASRA